MKEFTAIAVMTFIFTYTIGQFGFWDEFKDRADTVHSYEYKSLALTKVNRKLMRENLALKAKISRIESEREHLAMTIKNGKRDIASIPRKSQDDLVNFDLYKWSAEKLLGVGEQNLHFKKYEKSAQYYNSLVKEYPTHHAINDKVLFEAGIAAYESKKHYDWAVHHFTKLLKTHPKSKLYRGAKLWLALSQYYKGDQQAFVSTVEEFRAKYRNTKEWRVLSKYYEDIAYKYKK